MSLFPTRSSQALRRDTAAVQPSSPGESPAPLGSHPDYDDVLDVALAYTFPASDPISCQQCCHTAQTQAQASADGADADSRRGRHLSESPGAPRDAVEAGD